MMREFRVVCADGRCPSSGPLRSPLIARENAAASDRLFPMTAPHRVQYRDVPDWRDLEEAEEPT